TATTPSATAVPAHKSTVTTRPRTTAAKPLSTAKIPPVPKSRATMRW
ncbi:porin, partial [Escherichia coli]|nr:porin [Escherichia coli]